MTVLRLRLAGSLALLALGTTGCAAGRTGTEQAPGPPAASTEELEAIYRARLDSARMRFTADDVRFMQSMIAHHAQALVMARLAPTHDASPAVQTLAARIINAQQDEIATMQRWLRDRGQTVPEIHIEGTTLMVHGSEHGAHMPGMLSAEQLRELDLARAQAFDRKFLTFMIQHHRGAVVMVDALFATDGAGQDEDVFRFASDAQVDQRTEIARMELLLEELAPPASP